VQQQPAAVRIATSNSSDMIRMFITGRNNTCAPVTQAEDLAVYGPPKENS
jgi:hypothetical protein